MGRGEAGQYSMSMGTGDALSQSLSSLCPRCVSLHNFQDSKFEGAFRKLPSDLHSSCYDLNSVQSSFAPPHLEAFLLAGAGRDQGMAFVLLSALLCCVGPGLFSDVTCFIHGLPAVLVWRHLCSAHYHLSLHSGATTQQVWSGHYGLESLGVRSL